MKLHAMAMMVALAAAIPLVGGSAQAAPCTEVVLTGTQGGPPVFRGLAGSGTLVRVGETENQCGDLVLQFDTGRGTTQQLSKLGIPAGRVNAVFLTHLHSDHVEGLPDLMQVRWHFNSAGPKVDLVCNARAASPAGHAMDCPAFAGAIGDALKAAGEIDQRLLENNNRLPGGPAEIINIMTFEGASSPQVVWERGDVRVSAVATRHVPGHVSYRVDTPAGSVVIGGDAGNDVPKPPRDHSTSSQLEALASDADVLVHSVIHPVMGPDGGTKFPPPIFYRQSTATDLGALSDRAGIDTLMLTHLIPPLGAVRQGPYFLPDGALSEADYESAARDSGYAGNVIVGTDLARHRLIAE